MGVANARTRELLPDEVVVVDAFTTRPVMRSAEHLEHVTDAEMLRAEHTTPDGSAALPHEGRYLPLLIGGLATGGLLIVGIGMFIVGGVQAMAMGLAWVLAGYAVAWIVVWAAGVARAREEAEIEREIALKHASETRL